MNLDVKTQLLSTSLMAMLRKYDNKIAECLLRLNAHGYFKDSTRNVTLRMNKEMSFCPSGKNTILGDSGKWSKQNRQAGKYGKIIRKIIAEQVPRLKYTDKDLEELVNLLKSEVEEGTFKIVEGDDIKKWYLDDNYQENSGSLDGSCMRYEECQDYFDLYTCNSDKVKMLILTKSNGKLIGRALIWKGKWMDRIYGSDHTIEKFKQYAKNEGLIHKARQSYEDKTTWIDPIDGREFTQLIHINLDADHSEYPYVDTFSFATDGSITNDETSGWDKNLNCTDGSYEGDDSRTWDEWDDCYIDSDNSVYIETRGITTHVDNTTYDDLRDERILDDDSVRLLCSSDTHQDNENIVYCEEDDGYAHYEDTFLCDHDDRYYYAPSHEQVWIEELDINVHEDNVASAYENQGYTMDDDGDWVLPEAA